MFSKREREDAALICDLISNDEFSLFAEACEALGLSPFSRAGALACIAANTVNLARGRFEHDRPGVDIRSIGDLYCEAAALIRADGWLPGDEPVDLRPLPAPRDRLPDVSEEKDGPGHDCGDEGCACSEALDEEFDDGAADVETAPTIDVQTAVSPEAVDEILRTPYVEVTEVEEAIASDAETARAEDEPEAPAAAPVASEDDEDDDDDGEEPGSIFDSPVDDEDDDDEEDCL